MSDADASDDDDGGIPTWAIVLIVVVVAIPVLLMATVILAAVVGVFALGFGAGSGGGAAPVAEWNTTWDPGQGTVTFDHEEGDAVDREHLAVTVNGEPTSEWEASEERLTGSAVVVRGVEPGDEVTLVWDDGENRQMLAKYRAGSST